MGHWNELAEKYGYQRLREMSIREEVNLREFRENLMYAHIPKTGGTTMTENVSKHVAFKNCGHHFADARPCFSTVRNPFDWLMSMWHFNWGSGIGPVPGRRVQDIWTTPKNFLYEFNSYEKFSTDRYGGATSRWDILATPDSRPSFSFRHLQTCQTWDRLDTPGDKFSFAEFYIRLEKLDEAMSQWGISNIKRLNRRKNEWGDYRKYYDTKLIDHITMHRKQELDLLGYDFEGPTDELAVFKVNKPFVWK